jgi:hypothetical protein
MVLTNETIARIRRWVRQMPRANPERIAEAIRMNITPRKPHMEAIYLPIIKEELALLKLEKLLLGEN